MKNPRLPVLEAEMVLRVAEDCEVSWREAYQLMQEVER